MANGDIVEKSLIQLDQDIQSLLDDETLSTKELIRGLIRSQRAMLPFFSQVVTNTKKIDAMYPFYRASMWGLGILGAADLALIWGVLTHTFHFP